MNLVAGGVANKIRLGFKSLCGRNIFYGIFSALTEVGLFIAGAQRTQELVSGAIPSSNVALDILKMWTALIVVSICIVLPISAFCGYAVSGPASPEPVYISKAQIGSAQRAENQESAQAELAGH